MQYSSGADPAVQKFLQIGKDDKFYCKLLSKESSAANPSFRVYYGGAAGAVPFRWESLPGTPKHPSMAGAALPPLTPPPSYGHRGALTGAGRKHCSSGLLNSILPRRKPRAAAPSSPPADSLSSSSVSSSASSSFSPVMGSSNYRRRSRSRLSSPHSSFSSMPDVDDDESDGGVGSPTSTLCFGRRGGGFRRWYRMVVVKNALLSVVGRTAA